MFYLSHGYKRVFNCHLRRRGGDYIPISDRINAMFSNVSCVLIANVIKCTCLYRKLPINIYPQLPMRIEYAQSAILHNQQSYLPSAQPITIPDARLNCNIINAICSP